MTPLQRLKAEILRLPVIRSIRSTAHKSRASALLLDEERAQKAVDEVDATWRARIDDVVSCPDNSAIPRVPEAGILKDNVITMHNGVRVYGMSYYGAGILNMLIENKGVHEPQEEKAFMEVLEYLPANSTMLELGAYWAFYSLWLMSRLKDSTCYMVEPDDANIEAGKLNFKLNGKKGHFEQALVGESDQSPLTSLKTISVDGFCARHGIKHLNVLHSDIQGEEVKMLRGAKRMLSGGNVDYVFISTHSNELHEGCLEE